MDFIAVDIHKISVKIQKELSIEELPREFMNTKRDIQVKERCLFKNLRYFVNAKKYEKTEKEFSVNEKIGLIEKFIECVNNQGNSLQGLIKK